MPRPLTLPEKYHHYIADWTAEGLSCDKIRLKFESEFNISVGIGVITRIAKRIRLERQEAAKAAYAEEVAKTAGHDLRTMDKVITSLERRFGEAVQADDTEKYLKIAAELNKWNARRIELSGITRETQNTNDFQDDDEEIREEILRKTNILSKDAN